MKKLAMVFDVKQAEELIRAVDYYYRGINGNPPQLVLDLKQKHFAMKQPKGGGRNGNEGR